MADIQTEIAAFKSAVYGEDVRDAMVSLANKLNQEQSDAISEIEEIDKTFEGLHTKYPVDIVFEGGYGSNRRWCSQPLWLPAGSYVDFHANVDDRRLIVIQSAFPITSWQVWRQKTWGLNNYGCSSYKASSWYYPADEESRIVIENDGFVFLTVSAVAKPNDPVATESSTPPTGIADVYIPVGSIRQAIHQSIEAVWLAYNSGSNGLFKHKAGRINNINGFWISYAGAILVRWRYSLFPDVVVPFNDLVSLYRQFFSNTTNYIQVDEDGQTWVNAQSGMIFLNGVTGSLELRNVAYNSYQHMVLLLGASGYNQVIRNGLLNDKFIYDTASGSGGDDSGAIEHLEERMNILTNSTNSKLDEMDAAIKKATIEGETGEIDVQSIEWQNRDIADKLLAAKRPRNRTNEEDVDAGHGNSRPSGASYTAKPEVLTLLHFSDIHADATNLERIQSFKTYYGAYLNDAICTGDMVANIASDSMAWWDEKSDGSIIQVIGNHDCLVVPYSQPSQGNTSLQDRYDKFIAPYVSNWGDVVHQNGKTWFYKDYASAMVRLVVLDTCSTPNNAFDLSEQISWLTVVLLDAIEKNLAVIAAQHFPPKKAKRITTKFNEDKPSYQMNWLDDQFSKAIDTFQKNGGEFVCWLAGHTHQQVVCLDNAYQDQLFLVVPNASISSSTGDMARVVGTKSQDCFNVVAVDTYTKQIKVLRVGADRGNMMEKRSVLLIDYTTKQVLYDGE